MIASRTKGFAGLIGVGRSDVTPSLDVYGRCWGASKTDLMTGIHRPLVATALAFASHDRPQEFLVLVALDGSWWQSDDERPFRQELLERFSLRPEQLIVNLSHSHSAPPLSTALTARTGGTALAHYTRGLAGCVAPAIEKALQTLRPATLAATFGHCDLAHHRDFVPSDDAAPLIGMAPGVPSDTSLVALKITDEAQRVLAIGANYACHPTTLGVENDRFSPDFAGAFRETIESCIPGCHAFFLQGASGDLAPAYQYHGEIDVADRYGQKLAYSTLAVLCGARDEPSQLRLGETVLSGGDLAMWRPERVTLDRTLAARCIEFDLPLKPGFPTTAELESALREKGEEALHERLRRKLGLRRILGDASAYNALLWIWRLGDVLIAGAPFEAYSAWQESIRSWFPDTPTLVMNLVNGSPGYLPPASSYDEPRLYAVWQTPFDRGGLERLIEQTRLGFSEIRIP